MKKDISLVIRQHANPKKAKILQKFFKTRPGEYAQGDVFLGLTVPQVRKIIKEFLAIDTKTLIDLLQSKFHEERQAALFIMVYQYQKGTGDKKKEIFDIYMKYRKFINNWDLIDLTAPQIVGAYLENKNKEILIKLSKSENIWDRRIAILSTFQYIKYKNPKETLRIAEILVNDKHDLIHKAVGWMLREIGKRCSLKIEEKFLLKYYKIMPRTMLRYAIERFTEEKRKFYLAKNEKLRA